MWTISEAPELKLANREFEHCGIICQQSSDYSVVTHQDYYARTLSTINTVNLHLNKSEVALSAAQLAFVIVRWIGVEQPNEARHLRLQLQPATSCRRTHSWTFDSPKRRKPAYLTSRQITGTSFRLLVIADSAFGC